MTTNVVITMTKTELRAFISKEVAEKVADEVAEAVAKAVAPLKKEIKELKNKFAKLEYSLIYRDMVARVTASDERKEIAKKNPVLKQYLSAPRGGVSKLDAVKKQLHAVAHADEPGKRNYKRDSKDIQKRFKRYTKNV